MIIPLFHYSNLLNSNLPPFQYSNAVLAYLLLPFKKEMVAATASTELVAANL
jgi:hypothetical protein